MTNGLYTLTRVTNVPMNIKKGVVPKIWYLCVFEIEGLG